MNLKIFALASVALALTACGEKSTSTTQSTTATSGNQVELLNVSYDVSRDFYKAYNPLFIEHYKSIDPAISVSIKQSHGGSSKQALSVANGLAADVVTMNQNSDIDILVDKNLIAKDWQAALPNQSVPFTSSTVLLVRTGNPKGIKDWSDLTRSDIKIVMPNPKTSGNGRYAFLGAYGYGLHTFNKDEAKTDDFMKTLLSNVAVFDSGARAATTTFTQRGIGDVLITAENEANYIAHELNKGQFSVVYPSYTVATENPVALVSAVTDKKGSSKVAQEYLAYLYSDKAQALAASMYLRPSVPAVLEAHRERFPAMQTFLANDVFGDWQTIMTTYFKEGGKFDTLTLGNVKSN